MNKAFWFLFLFCDTNIPTEDPVPVITFQTSRFKIDSQFSISNVEYVFKDVEWQDINEQIISQEVMAWLPRENAVIDPVTFAGYYGLVRVKRYKTNLNTPYRSNIWIEKTAESSVFVEK